ncbi:DUF2934 domain-containing protein [Acidisoma cellulosilytica]|uniref:DUF2934 domain-containing protein n=2 Tax=Acidisoma cellulosilyticum TaxID=2802395 RepID=A0A964E2I2_9PROT|nr:DUF2934 domain-containing protein [Acidisoma cellulosilyticum]
MLRHRATKKGNAAMSDTQDEDRLQLIRETAYGLWEQEGYPEGREHEFWLRAEKIVDGEAEVDAESADSFPASDAPSFNP